MLDIKYCHDARVKVLVALLEHDFYSFTFFFGGGVRPCRCYTMPFLKAWALLICPLLIDWNTGWILKNREAGDKGRIEINVLNSGKLKELKKKCRKTVGSKTMRLDTSKVMLFYSSHNSFEKSRP